MSVGDEIRAKLLPLFEKEFEQAIAMADMLFLQGFKKDFAAALEMTSAPVFQLLRDCDDTTVKQAEQIAQRLILRKMAMEAWAQSFPAFPVHDKEIDHQ